MKILILLLFPFVAFGFPKIPDVSFTYPHLCSVKDSDFREFRYDQKVPYCQRNVSQSMRDRVYDKYEIPVEKRSEFTIDHLVPLSLGGSNSIKNLWPQHMTINTAVIEGHIFRQVRDGEITIQEAINNILDVKYSNRCD